MRVVVQHTLLLLAVFFMTSSAFAQGWTPCSISKFRKDKAVCDSMYAAKANYRLTMTMASYRSITDPLPHDQGQAVIVRSGKTYRSEQLGIITVQNETMRVTVDKEDRLIVISKPSALDELFVTQFSTKVIEGLATVSYRLVAGMTEYKLVFGAGAIYDHMIVRYDVNGWLRSTETHWRRPIAEYPDDPQSKSYTPKLVMTYDVPLAHNTVSAEMDPNTYVSQRNGEHVGVGPFASFEVFDGRVQQ